MKCKYRNSLSDAGFCTVACMYCTGDQEARCKHKKAQPTNADRFRAMSNKELAEFIILSPEMEFDVCRYCKYGNTVPDDRGQCLTPRGHCIAQDRCDAFKLWLQQPAPREEGGS